MVKYLQNQHIDYWNSSLDHLSVQSKFKDIIDLQPESRTWNRLPSGLPAGQISFLIRAGTDCLPTPLNLRRWRYRVSSLCPLCNSPSAPQFIFWTAAKRHLLKEDAPGDMTRCSTASLLWSRKKSLLTQNSMPIYLVFELVNPATLPANLSTSTTRPDIVIVSEKNVTMIELTIPSNSRDALIRAKERKNNKPNYNSLIGDLEDRGLSVNYISNTGNWIARSLSIWCSLLHLLLI